MFFKVIVVIILEFKNINH